LTIVLQSLLVWCNYHLRSRQLTVESLDEGLRDGRHFTVLLDVLRGRPLAPELLSSMSSHAPPLLRQSLQYVRALLSALPELGQEVPLEFQAEDILDGNHAAICALLWPLVSISLTPATAPAPHTEQKARASLLHWCRARAKPHVIDNFDVSFRDGTALCAILAGCLNEEEEATERHLRSLPAGPGALREALQLAERRGGIPRGFLLIDAFNQTDFVPDERCVIALLGCVQRAFAV
jgi:hypothetical protein